MNAPIHPRLTLLFAPSPFRFASLLMIAGLAASPGLAQLHPTPHAPTPAPAATTTTLALTANGTAATSVSGGTPVTFTATVSTGSPVTAGTVNFCDATAAICSDVHLLGSAPLTAAGTATLLVVPPLGVHTYKAIFIGTTTNALSTSPVTNLTVSAATATAISQSGTSGNYTLKATVTGKGLPSAPTGTVSFLNTSLSNSLLTSVNLTAGTPGTPTWVTTQSPGVAPQPQSIVVGDFNGDGIADIAVGTQAIAGATPVSASISILLGNGDGTFQAARKLNTTLNNGSMVAGQFVSGGKLDILSVDPNASGTNNAVLFQGDGTGGGTVGTPFSLGGMTLVNGVAAADLNRDGNQDFVITGIVYGVWCFANVNGNGNGTFGSPTLNAVGSNPLAVIVGAFNSNSYPDIVVADSVANQVTVFQNNSQGFFFPGSVSYNVGTTPVALATGDFNGDGFLDLAVVNKGGGNVTILLGHGDETLTAVSSSPNVGNSPTSIAVSDFNHDGIPDLAVTNSGDGTVTILTGNGDGTFTSTATLTVGNTPLALTAGNFSNTGIDTLAIANEDPAAATGSSVTVFASSLTQTATATATAVNVTGTGTQLVDASYPGDTSYAPSVSTTTSVTGTSPAYALSVSPLSLTFASTQAGAISAAQTVTLTNTGSNAVSISSVAATSNFAVASACGASVAVSASCSLSVTFVPQTGLTGSLTGTLTITDNATGSPQSVSLSGTATPPPPTVTLLPASLAFPSTIAGQSSAAQTVTLTNTGQSAVTIASIVLSPNFVASTTCPATLAVAAHCTYSVVFAPTAPGTLAGTLSVKDNATGSPQTVALSGTGTLPPPTLSVSPTTLTFAAADIGTTSTAQTVTLTNTGQSAVSITSIAASGAFTETNTCGSSLAVSGNCTIAVVFAPTVGGSATGSLTITDSATGSPQTVALSGTGQSVSITIPTSAPLTLNPGTPTATLTLNVASSQGFSGAVNLSCKVNFLGSGTATNPPTCSLNPSSGQLTASQSLNSTLTVTLNPTTATARLTDPAVAPGSSSPTRSSWLGGSAALAALMFLGVLPRRRWKGMRLVLFLSLGLGLSWMATGCGGSNGPKATPGSYSVVVTATSATVTASATIPLTVN